MSASRSAKVQYWTRTGSKAAQSVTEQLNNAKPSVVGDLIKSPFAGIERDVAAKERFYSVTLSANSGRVVVRDWLSIPLDVAIENFKQWFLDLEIATLGAAIESEDEKAGPLSLFRLAGATVRVLKDLRSKSDLIAALYRAAWQRTAPSLSLLQPLLAEFRSALVTDSKQKPQYPFSQSRFALLKLILLRNARNEGFMPKVHLCETDDPAYNLGRLLCVLASLQDAAHEYELEGPGVVERYYGTASTAPANVFGVLWKLHIHHLRKLEQQGEPGKKSAYHIRGRIADIVAGFAPAGENLPPRFPQTLSLEEQGRFALGFYQQMAADRRAIQDRNARNKSEPKS